MAAPVPRAYHVGQDPWHPRVATTRTETCETRNPRGDRDIDPVTVAGLLGHANPRTDCQKRAESVGAFTWIQEETGREVGLGTV